LLLAVREHLSFESKQREKHQHVIRGKEKIGGKRGRRRKGKKKRNNLRDPSPVKLRDRKTWQRKQGYILRLIEPVHDLIILKYPGKVYCKGGRKKL